MSANFCGLVLDFDNLLWGYVNFQINPGYILLNKCLNLTLALIRYCAFILTSE